jgi:hypothetical protein
VLSTKSGGPIAATWAILNYLGKDGYLALARKTQAAAAKICAAVERIPGLRILGRPPGNLLAIASDTCDVFALADAMKAKGWFLQPQFGYGPSPANLHLSIGASNAPHIEAMLHDLEAEAARLSADPQYRPSPPPPDQIAALATMPAADLLDAMAGLFNGADGGLPQEMRPINALMNAMPFQARDQVLVEYMNRLYAKA